MVWFFFLFFVLCHCTLDYRDFSWFSCLLVCLSWGSGYLAIFHTYMGARAVTLNATKNNVNSYHDLSSRGELLGFSVFFLQCVSVNKIMKISVSPFVLDVCSNLILILSCLFFSNSGSEFISYFLKIGLKSG